MVSIIIFFLFSLQQNIKCWNGESSTISKTKPPTQSQLQDTKCQPVHVKSDKLPKEVNCPNSNACIFAEYDKFTLLDCYWDQNINQYNLYKDNQCHIPFVPFTKICHHELCNDTFFPSYNSNQIFYALILIIGLFIAIVSLIVFCRSMNKKNLANIEKKLMDEKMNVLFMKNNTFDSSDFRIINDLERKSQEFDNKVIIDQQNAKMDAKKESMTTFEKNLKMFCSCQLSDEPCLKKTNV